MKKVVTAIIVNQDKVLFFQRDNVSTIADPDKWQLPGGFIEEGESPENAVTRELQEEVNYSPVNLTYLGALRTEVSETHVFWSYVDDDEITKFRLGADEGQALEFLTIDQVLEKNLTDNTRFYLTAMKAKLIQLFEEHRVPSSEDFKLH